MSEVGGEQLLLVHGARDENVEMMHTMLLSRALINHATTFNQMVKGDIV